MQSFDGLDDNWRRSLFDEAPAPMALVAGDHRFLRCNDAYCRLVGYGRSELLNRTWKSITHPDDVDGDTHGAESLKSDAKSDVYTITKRYIHKEGEVVWTNLFVRAVRIEGQFQCFYVVANPIQHTRRGPSEAVASKPKGIVEWVKANPRDSLLVSTAAIAVFGRDTVVEFVKSLLLK